MYYKLETLDVCGSNQTALTDELQNMSYPWSVVFTTYAGYAQLVFLLHDGGIELVDLHGGKQFRVYPPTHTLLDRVYPSITEKNILPEKN